MTNVTSSLGKPSKKQRHVIIACTDAKSSCSVVVYLVSAGVNFLYSKATGLSFVSGLLLNRYNRHQ